MVIIMSKLAESKNYIWSFPLLAGVLTIIGLLTPSSAFEDVEINWMWGLRYFNLLPVDEGFNWIFELTPKDFTPIIFVCKIIPFIVLLAISIFSIILAIKLRKQGDFQKFERKWLLCGILLIIVAIVYLIEIEVLMRFYYDEYFGLDMGYWENYTPGFAIVAPFISGVVILVGFYVNKFVLPKKEEMIFRIRRIYRNIIYTFLLGFSILLIGVSISFIVYKLMPGDPVVGYLNAYGIFPYTQEQYDNMEELLGLDLHIIIQFFRYLGDFFIGNWKISISIILRRKVTNLVVLSISRMIGFYIFPLLIGLGTGIWCGKRSFRYRGTWKDKLMQMLCIPSLAIPIFFFGMVTQYFFSFKLPVFSPIGNSLVPMYIMTLSTFALITLQTRSHMVNKPYETSMVPNTIKIANIFGLLFTFYLLLDITFSLNGIGVLLIESIQLFDIYVLAGVLYSLVIALVFIIIISNLIFSYNKYRNSDITNTENASQIINSEQEREIDAKDENEESIKDYLKRRVKSPYTIIGAILIIFLIFISIFPQSFTDFSFKDAMVPAAGSWDPASSDHPLGQTQLGWDVLAWVIYGIRTSMFVGLGAVLISLTLGGSFGFATRIFNRRAYKPIMGLLTLFFIFPTIVFVVLVLAIYSWTMIMSMVVIGVLLTPNITKVVANAVSRDINIKRVIKKVLSHIPLNFALAVMIYEAVGFIGFGGPGMIELGKSINIARSNLYMAPWATLWPGLAIFGIVFSSLILHIGLQGYDPKLRELENIELK